MTHFSLKKSALVATVCALSVGAYTLAEPVTTSCTQNPVFAANACNVCYTDTHIPTKDASGWSMELTDVVIPWEHSGIDLQEVITEGAQKLPEIIPSADVKVTPTEADKIWEFGTDIVWYDVGSDREFFIDKGDKVGLYTLKTNTKIALTGKGTKDTVLIKTPLAYEEYEKDLAQSSSGKVRNICILNTFNTGTTPQTPPVVVPPTTAVPEVTITLNAAGPEEDEEPVTPEITPEQTETQAGPGMWIFLLLAFAFSSAWTAWKKQQKV